MERKNDSAMLYMLEPAALLAALACLSCGALFQAAALICLALALGAARLGLTAWRKRRFGALLRELKEKKYTEEAFRSYCALPGYDLLRQAVEAQLGMEKEDDAIAESERQATLQALQSQINPHFLYNTLECIRGQALLDGNGSIASMLEALGNFFRYSISRRENIVTLADEIGNINSYMLIQNYRFSNRYKLEIDFLEDRDALMGCYIPKLTLQPIIENALLHAFQNRKTGTITLTADASDSALLLTVSDDGEGMDEKTLDALNKKIQRRQAMPRRPASHGNGIALQSLNRRIAMLYGQGYGIHAYSTLGLGTDVEIIVPRITQMEIDR